MRAAGSNFVYTQATGMSGRLRITFTYTIIFLFAFERCAYNDIKVAFDCSTSTLGIEVTHKSNVSNCRAIDGSIVVAGTGGLEPYSYKLNNGEYQSNNTFHDLGPGTYTLRVKDMNECWVETQVSIDAAGSTLSASAAATADSQCTGGNGSITVTATGGVAPYQFQLDDQGYGASNSFTSVREGQHVVIIKDNEGCQRTLAVTIAHGNTGVKYATEVKPIITNFCATSGCHDAGTGARNWTTFSNLKANAANIKTRVINRTMPPSSSLTQAQIDLISCWVDDGAPEN